MFALVSIRMWIMLAMTILATLLCSPGLLSLRWGTSMSIVAIGVVFPLVFAIQAAYSSRGSAQKHLADLKARSMFLYFQMRAYDRKYGIALAERTRDLISDLSVATIRTLQGNEPSHECYDTIAVLVNEVTQGTADKLPAPLFGSVSGCEIGRPLQR